MLSVTIVSAFVPRKITPTRCDERLKTRVEESTCLTYTGFLGVLEHLKIETRLMKVEKEIIK